MISIRKLLVSMILVGAMSLPCHAVEGKDYWLVVSLHDGTIEAYPLADSPKIAIEGGTFSVVSATRTVNYALKSINRFHVTDDYSDHHHTINADVNADGAVDVADISTVISVMSGNAVVPDAAADINGDGIVDVADISAVISVMAFK